MIKNNCFICNNFFSLLIKLLSEIPLKELKHKEVANFVRKYVSGVRGINKL